MHGQISTFLFSPFICVEFVYLLWATLFLSTFVETDNRKNEIKSYEVFQQGKRHLLLQ